MSGRYLEDFAVGQTFGSGRLRVDKEQIKAFAAEFDPQPFHLDEDAARDKSFAGWRRAAGIRRLSPCGFWSRARSSLQAASWARESMSSAGRGPCGLGTSSISKVKCSRCDRRGRVQIKD
jgi:acyl dehydratase